MYTLNFVVKDNIISAGYWWESSRIININKNKFLLIFINFSFIIKALLNFFIYNSCNFLSNKINYLTNIELIKKYEHIKKHSKPINDEDFGYYLAGLIEGDGYIGKRSIEIAFHIDDINLAYFIKERIGYGNIIKYSHTSNAVRYGVWNREGIKKY